MKIDEFANVLCMPVDDMVNIGEKQALNPNSKIYQTIKLEISKKLAAVRAVADVEKKKRTRNRVYVQHVVSTTDRYTLSATFPQWDIKFANAYLASAARARAVYVLTSEYLLEKVKTTKGSIVAWGFDTRTIVMRSREWVHLCVPGHEMSTQADFIMQDRSILAMVNAAASRGRDPGLPKRYIQNKQSIHCTTPTTCRHVGNAGLMMLHRTDTNFRQIAHWMDQHTMDLCYIALPGGKDLELCTAGYLTELDAYTHPSEDGRRIDLIYKHDQNLSVSYTYSNYLELVARVEVRIGDYIYRKETDNKFLGVLTYKITRFKADPQILPSSIVYRSWLEPDHENQYMVYAPVLASDGYVGNKDDWQLVAFPVRREVIDDVHDAAMRAQGVKDLMGFIAKRLNSKTSTVIVMNQVVQRNKFLAVTRFDLLVFVIYCSVFMRKFKDGQAVATLAPHARDIAMMSRQGTLGLFSVYIRTLLKSSVTGVTQLISELRKFYYDIDAEFDLPLPSFLIEPGYTLYGDSASTNPRFKSWETPDGNPAYGFSPSLPGAQYSKMLPFNKIFDAVIDDAVTSDTESVDPMLFVTGEAVVSNETQRNNPLQQKIRARDVILREDATNVSTYLSGAVSYLSGVFDQQPDLEEVIQQDSDKDDLTVDDGFYTDQSRFDSSREVDKDLKPRVTSDSEVVNRIVNKIVADNDNLITSPRRFKYTTIFDTGSIPEIIPGSASVDPVVDLSDGLSKIFPKSLMMNTVFFEGDKNYGDLDLSMKGNRMKIDLSKLAPLKHESFYLPIIRGHVHPDIIDNQNNTLRVFQKRNANTPDSTVPMDEQRLMEGAFSAYLKVFCKPGTREILDSWPYIGPDQTAVNEWVTRLPEGKKAKHDSQDGYSTDQLDLARNTLILKKKLKPALDASYATAVKAPQSIQFDSTGKSTATLSPIIGLKVEREQSVLKPNVLVLQRKSVDDINNFLNGFDWRPDQRGERLYIEMDYQSFDKSQGATASKLHWHKCAEYGILPKFVDFLKQHNQTRSISALESGVKMFLDVQRGSGHPDTLDGNNDVNQMAIAEFLLEILDKIEFVIIQGDDIIIAIRGNMPDLSGWSDEVSRRYNLSMKLSIQKHGYICSYDIVHLPDGHSLVVADVVKRSLSFLSVSKKDQEEFKEQYISFVDNMRYIEDIRVQRYLSENLPKRMQKYLPGTSPEAINLLCKACTAIKSDYSKFKGMFADKPSTRYY